MLGVKGRDIASATALRLGPDGSYFHVTGTTTITSISTMPAGVVVFLEFDGALTFTHNATNLILFGAVNRTTVAGDVSVLISEGAGNWREIARNPSAFAFTNGQIAFPATQNPSSDANTLDDYEEGTWTPADGSGASLSLTVTTAKYTKIGRAVLLDLNVTYPATASGLNSRISGLPFTCVDNGVASLRSNSASNAICGDFAGGASILDPTAAADVNVTNAQLSGKYVIATVPYQV